MTVKVRHLNETTAEARTFASVNNETELMDLIGFVKRSGGIYMSEEGSTDPFHSYQLVMDEKEVFAEIIIGKED
ncbi:MAG: hypothetical protein PHU86_03825 [Patescibacteria group bacterium]|nr:hypothetical protein [Patescibacteria group bacterium]